MKLLIAGVSTRAAAESAARAGFEVTAIDAFGDLDQHPSVRVVPLAGRFTARAAAHEALSVECDAAVYLANFENHPKAVSMLAEGRALWGNPPEVIRRVRDPQLLAEALARRGLAVPKTYPYVVSGFSRTFGRGRTKRKWLVKPLASGGGQRIRLWQRGEDLPRACYLQELIEGTPGSVVFVAARGQSVPLGVTRQLVGEEAFGVAGYQYCGNILENAKAALLKASSALARAVTEEFALVGLNGIDFIVRDRVPYAIEVNPRWCASMELVERAHGLPVLEAHASACAAGELPAFDLRARSAARPAAFGKAVVYARQDVVIGDSRAWLGRDDIRDIPHPGEHIPAGRPVCTVFAEGRDAAACHDALVQRAERVHAEIGYA